MSFHPFAAALAVAAVSGAFAAQAEAPAAAGVAPMLSASSEQLSMSAAGGAPAHRALTITAPATGPAGALNVTLGRTGGTLGQLAIDKDSCSGATLAAGQSCRLALHFDSSCPSAETSSWVLLVTGTSAEPVAIPVTGKSEGGDCK